MTNWGFPHVIGGVADRGDNTKGSRTFVPGEAESLGHGLS